MEIFASKFNSPLGTMAIASDGNALFRIYFDAKVCPYEFQEDDVCLQTMDWLQDYFDKKCPDPLRVPVAFGGTDFQKQVWELLRAIPYGQAVTYGELAQNIAQIRGIPKMSAQAVGQAVGANKLPIVVPCHRIIGANGSLVGFSDGLHIKKWLLHHEGIL